MSKTDALNLFAFMQEHHKTGGLDQIIVDHISQLVDKYKLDFFDKNCTIIGADLGRLGSVVCREILSVNLEDVKKLTYESNSYDFISIKVKSTTRILWTDFQNIEPYNRQSGLYCDGASFESLGEPVLVTNEYREFNSTTEGFGYNLSFAVWGFSFNTFYKSLRFGLSIKTELVPEFIKELRILLDKSTILDKTLTDVSEIIKSNKN